MVNGVWLYNESEGYCPPDFYPKLNNSTDVSNFLTRTLDQQFKTFDVTHSVDNNIGRAVFPISSDKLTSTYDSKIIRVVYNDNCYIGLIDRVRYLSKTSVEVTYTVDWWTSYILTKFSANEQYGGIIADSVMYRRLTTGEFTYSDEGLTPLSTTIETKDIKCTAEPGTFFFLDGSTPVSYSKYEGKLFSSGGYGWGATYYVIYNSPPNDNNDKDLLIKCLYVGGFNSFAPNQIATTFSDILTAYSRTQPFNPNNILFIGLIPIAPQILIRNTARLKSVVPDTYLGVYALGGSVIGNQPFYLYMDEESVATFYNKQRIEMADGVSVYDVPYGKAIPDNVIDTATRFTVTPFISESLVAPSLTLKIDNEYWCQSSTTMTLPIYSIGLIKDSDTIYKAEERDYQKAMLSLQSQNELASGVIGGINQGAMISAFSRNQTSTGTDKGIIGGGMAVISAGLNFLYQDLYANKKATEINDIYNRCKPDVLAQDGCISAYIVTDNAGLRIYKYDANTIANIQAYQSVFGYQSNKIDSAVKLNNLSGYVQADVIFKKPLRTEVMKYIKNMFNYGITFT